MTSARPQRMFIALMLTPAFVLFTVFVAVPSLRALIYSLQKWNGFADPQWVGFENFRTLFTDDLFFPALRHNLILMVGAGSITIILALTFASLLHRRVRGAALFRVVFFFPNVLAAVAIAILWLLLYSATKFGVFNGILLFVRDLLENAGIGILQDQLPFAFTDSAHLIYALIPMLVWTAVGFYMVLFIAAMEGIPEELYEAARLDGARGFSQFWHITLPLIREVLVVGIVFFIISTAKFFDAVWVMESQYPTRESHVLATVLYQKVFTEYNVGYAAAVAVVLFVLVFCATLVTLRWSRREALEY